MKKLGDLKVCFVSSSISVVLGLDLNKSISLCEF